MKEFLKIKKLDKIYTQSKTVQTQALKNINLNFKRGEFVVISGPSGSGKTTLLNMIGGLDVPTGGNIHLEGVDIIALKEKKLADIRLHNIGFIFQAYNLIPVLTAMENIEYIMMLQGIPEEERRKKAEKTAAHLGIKDLLNKKPNEMSGGQQQRVAVARSIVSEPKLVLADLMKQLNEEKKITFIFSTHEKMVMEKADRNIVLRDGKIFSDK
jgi:putative ABC transport system ATP-binding protein